MRKLLKLGFHIMVIFFVSIFILGIFSKQVIGFFVPEVFTMYPRREPVTKTIVTQGTIGPKNTEYLISGLDFEIETFYVSEGDYVKKGDALFKIKDSSQVDLQRVLIESQIIDLNKNQKNEQFQVAQSKLMESQIQNELSNNAKKIKEIEIMEEIEKRAIREKEDLDQIQKELELQKNKNTKLESERFNYQNALDKLKKADLEKHLEQAQMGKKIYMGQDGICYSNGNYLITKATQTKDIVKDSEIFRILSEQEYGNLVLRVKLPYQEYIWLGNVPIIEVKNGNKVLNAYVQDVFNDKEGNIIVEGGFPNDDISDLVIDGDYECKLEYKIESLGAVAVPKMLITAPQGFKDGNVGYINVVEVKNGILGQEAFVKKKAIDLVVVGDNSVLVPQEGSLRVITTISDKIQNGKKVFLIEE